jgi:hypothetical protein
MESENGFSTRILHDGLSRVTNAALRSITGNSWKCDRDVLVNVLGKSRMASLASWAVWMLVLSVAIDHRTEGPEILPPLPGVVAETPGVARLHPGDANCGPINEVRSSSRFLAPDVSAMACCGECSDEHVDHLRY